MNEQKKRREKIVTRKTILQHIIICLISIFISFIVLKYIIENLTQGQLNIFGEGETEKLFLKIMLFGVVIIHISIFICMLNISIERAKIKLYKKIVQELLPIDTYVKVYPQKGYLKLPKVFQEQISHYFAILNKDGEIDIVVTLKEYYNGDHYHLFEKIQKENFLNSYEVINKKQCNTYERWNKKEK